MFWQKAVDYSLYVLENLCVQLVNNVLNEFVQCIISYIKHDLFVDTKEEPSNKELLNKFGRVYFVLVSSKFPATCHVQEHNHVCKLLP